MKKIVWIVPGLILGCAASAGARNSEPTLAKTHAFDGKPSKSMVGTWLLNGNVRNTRFVFRKNGTFAFSGSDCSSAGKWLPDPAGVKLVWTQSDGKKVAPGTIKAVYPIQPDGSMQINKFNYRKVN